MQERGQFHDFIIKEKDALTTLWRLNFLFEKYIFSTNIKGTVLRSKPIFFEDEIILQL